MLITTEIKIPINKFNLLPMCKKYGVPLVIGEIFKLDITDLSHGSDRPVDVSCDYCSDILKIPYSRYIKSLKKHDKYSCRMCRYIKVKETNLSKYGVENPFQSEKIKEKIKESNLEKYGVENPAQSSVIKNKIKETNLERYGVESYTQTKEYMLSVGVTCMSKYGYKHHLVSDEIKDKIKSTNLIRYGSEYYTHTNIFRKAVKETNLEKYGVENPFQSEEIKNKIKETNLEKYGVENPFQSEEIKNKIKETNLEKYGVEYHQQSTSYWELYYMITSNSNYIEYLGDCMSLFKCDCGESHTFEISSSTYYSRKKLNNPLCVSCYPISDNVSIKERKVSDYIKSIYDGVIINNYRVNRKEVDIYLPELGIGFEFNGLYYHSSKFKKSNYHLDKTNYFKTQNIRIIHIWEDDIIYREDIVNSQLCNYIGFSNKIYGRNCVVREITDGDSVTVFLNNNHIQGSTNCVVKFGLYFEENLVSVMTFDKLEGRKRMGESEYNLNRFCNILNYTVIGGASKLLKCFINEYKPNRIISYADLSWSSGGLYNNLGFDELYRTGPDYKYIIGDDRVHKSRYSKSKTGISERDLDLLRIYDCGKIKFEKLIK